MSDNVIPVRARVNDDFRRNQALGKLSKERGRLTYLVFDHDLAGLVGNLLKNDFDLKNDILAIDGLTLHDFDFIDLGKVLEPSGTVPVTIKSLVFQF
jgi:ethanolamine utilization protein EutA